MFGSDTLKIAKIIKSVPDSQSEDGFPMKLFSDLVVEASKYGISRYALEAALSRLPQQGLASVYRSHDGDILGVIPTQIFRNLFL